MDNDQKKDEIVYIDPTLLTCTNINCRKGEVKKKIIKGMMKSIKKGDFIAPILCRPSKKEKGKYEIVDGQHRHIAYQKCRQNAPCVIRDLDDKKSRTSSLNANTMRNDMTEKQIIDNFLCLYQNGSSVEEIMSEHNRKDKTTLNQDIEVAYFVCDYVKEKLHSRNRTLAREYLSKVKNEYQVELYSILEKQNVGTSKMSPMKNAYTEYIDKNPTALHNKTIKDIPITLSEFNFEISNVETIDQCENNDCGYYGKSYKFSVGSEEEEATKKELKKILLSIQDDLSLLKFSSMIQKQLENSK